MSTDLQKTPPRPRLVPPYDNGKVKIGKVNIDDHAGLAAQFRIASIPTLLIFKKGEVVEQIVGAKPKGALRASLDKAAA